MKKFYILAIIFALIGMTVLAQQKPKTQPKTQPKKQPKTTPKTQPKTQPEKTTAPAKSTTTEPKPAAAPPKPTTTKEKSKSKPKEKTKKAAKPATSQPKESVKPSGDKQRRAALPYYQIQNFITLNAGFFYMKLPRTTTLPVYFTPELTITNNITLGIQGMHYQYKAFVQYNQLKDNSGNPVPAYGYTEYTDYEKKFNHLLAALKVSYHLNDIVKDNLKILVNPEKLDLYVAGLAGYNFVFPGAPPKASEVKLGFSVGGRVLYSKKLAFFMEYGINDYGYGSMGASWLLGERF